MKIGAIIQARATSTRLPNKIFKELPHNSGVKVIEQVIRRLKKSKFINEIVAATTINKQDDIIQDIILNENIKIYRGSEENVLERFYLAAKENNLDIIVRITADCPCIDWGIIDKLIEIHIENKNDYTSNTGKRTFPHGVDAEVFNFKVLEEAYKNADKKYEIEHVTPYIYKTNFNKYKIYNLEAEKNINRPDIRITLDTKEDYTLLCAVYDFLYEKNNFFNVDDIVKLIEEKEWILNINENIIQKKICDNYEDEYEEALKILEKQELYRVIQYLKEKKNDK